MNQERDLLIRRIELIGDDYDLTDYINSRLEKLGFKFVRDLPPINLVDLYDGLLIKIYQ
jgi:hypothetical protein